MIVLDMLMDGIRFQSFQFKMKIELGKKKKINKSKYTNKLKREST